MTLCVFLSHPNSFWSEGFTPPSWVCASSTSTPGIAPLAFMFVAFDFSLGGRSFSSDINAPQDLGLQPRQTPPAITTQSIFNPPFFKVNP